MDTKEKLFSCIGLLVVAVLMIFLQAVVYGFVLSLLYAWFIVPVYHVQEINTGQAIGISLIVGFLRYRSDSSESSETRTTGKMFEAYANSLMYPFLTLFIAYLFYITIAH